jgi:putative transposon-encoded protein
MGTLKSLKTKLSNNNSVIAKDDKGSSIVILTIQEHDNKINSFVTASHFLTINSDPTIISKNTIRKITNSSKILIPQEHIWKYFDLNPSPPKTK